MLRPFLLFLFGVLSLHNVQGQLVTYEKLDTAHVFTSIEEALVTPNQVLRLDLSKEKLTGFPEEILKFTNLNELVLDKNKIDSIPPSIAQLQHLQRISVYRNYLTNMEFIGLLPNLKYIDLTANYLEKIPNNILNLTDLRVLILQLNTIVEYPEDMNELVALEVFNLLDNELNRKQQTEIRNMFPEINVEMSAPCKCNE